MSMRTNAQSSSMTKDVGFERSLMTSTCLWLMGWGTRTNWYVEYMNKVLSTWFKRYLSRPEAVTLLAIFIVMVLVLSTMGQVLTPVIISMLLAYLLLGVVRYLERWHLSHILAVSMVFIVFITLLLLAFLWLLPLLWDEVVGLVTEVPGILSNGQALIFKLHDTFPDLVSVIQLQQFITHLTAYLANFGKEVVSFSLASLFGIVAIIVYLVLVPLLVFFFMRDGREIIGWFARFLPDKRYVLQNVWDELHGKIRSYVRGKVIEILFVALITTVVFGVLGLRYAILLGGLVGLSVVVPYVGIALVTVPIVIIGLMQWGWSDHFFYLMAAHAVISILDANILVPVLFSEAMNLHPLAIILAVLIFGNIFGFWGVFFAIPLITLVNVVIKSWPKEDKICE